jgi:hypothetical protein
MREKLGTYYRKGQIYPYETIGLAQNFEISRRYQPLLKTGEFQLKNSLAKAGFSRLIFATV